MSEQLVPRSRCVAATQSILESRSCLNSIKKEVMALLFVDVLMGALDLAIIGSALPAIPSEFILDSRNLSRCPASQGVFNLRV